MKCKSCNQEINENFKYCPFCGEKVIKEYVNELNVNLDNEKIPDENIKDIIQNYSIQPTKPLFNDKAKGSHSAMIAGIIAIVTGFLGGTFVYAGAITGLFGLVLGIKNYTTETQKKAMWGIILGFVGLLLSITQGIIFMQDETFKNNATNKYETELNIELPDDSLYTFYRDNNINKPYSFHANTVSYMLTEQEMDKYYNDFIANDLRWNSSPVNQTLVNQLEELNLYNLNGYYLCYNRKSKQFEVPSSYNNYDLVIVVVDYDNNLIIVFDVWNLE